jgi:hypothetical protein
VVWSAARSPLLFLACFDRVESALCSTSIRSAKWHGLSDRSVTIHHTLHVRRARAPRRRWKNARTDDGCIVRNIVHDLYQGQEIGMTNFPESWDMREYKDVDS